ncbi:hypothetical protein VNI00_014663 [Paramarasmius palmivorus]|uniref:Fungal-type protein kinase domain-containing protein n=1 Tax=Paramarasmius palmivorus TaxID=297713 RepID=A0AAW0BVH5_9AGAR
MSSWELKKEKDTIVLPPDFRKGEYTIQQNTKSTISPRQGVLKEANEHIDARGRGEKFEPMSESNHEGSGSRHVRTGKNTAFAQSPEGRTSARLQKAGGKRPAEDYPKPHAEVQVVMHAAESMNAQIGRAQVLNFIIRYSRLWIWYFDRESPIQSSGFDILEDLPYFLALLFILQRFDKKDWGFIPELSTDEIRLGGRTSNVFHRNREESMTAHHGLSGRYPQVLYGTFQQRHAAFKPTHAEVIRTSEVDILNKAHKLLKGVPNMQACLPELLDFKDFDDFNTSHIRQALGIKADGDKPSHRVPRAIIFVFYLPLVSLTTDMEIFRAAFVRLICCHAILWLHGIEHGDISVANGGKTELLTDDAMAGKVKRVYRHDADAFSWVLLWVLGRYRGGKLLELEEGRLFDPWATQITFAEIYQKRSTAYTSIMNQEAVFPQPLSDNFRRDALRFIVYLRTARLDRESAVAKLVFQEDSHLGQKLQKELAILDSPTFVQSVLNTTLIADSKYSGLVKVRLGGLHAERVDWSIGKWVSIDSDYHC